jgi:hypothetical protein
MWMGKKNLRKIWEATNGIVEKYYRKTCTCHYRHENDKDEEEGG